MKTLKTISLILFFISSIMLGCSHTQVNESKERISEQIDTFNYNVNEQFDSIFKRIASGPTIKQFVEKSKIGQEFCVLEQVFIHSNLECEKRTIQLLENEQKQFVRFSPMNNEVNLYCKSNYENFKSFIVRDIGFLLMDIKRNLKLFVSPPSGESLGISNKSIGVIYFLDNTTLLPTFSIKKVPNMSKLYIEIYDYESDNDNDFYGYRSQIEQLTLDSLTYQDLLQINAGVKSMRVENMERIFLEGKGSFRKFPLWTFSECINCFQILKE